MIFTYFFLFSLNKISGFIVECRARKPNDEDDRLRALAEDRILGTQPEQCYDDITKIASLVCCTPISLMSLVDAEKQWFKSRFGFQT